MLILLFVADKEGNQNDLQPIHRLTRDTETAPTAAATKPEENNYTGNPIHYFLNTILGCTESCYLTNLSVEFCCSLNRILYALFIFIPQNDTVVQGVIVLVPTVCSKF